ncbi:hypothetical protein BOX15_Mlig032499g1, partial [Macrostomum lignano]
VMRQFHSDTQEDLLAMLGKVVRSQLDQLPQGKQPEYPPDLIHTMVFLRDYCFLSRLPMKKLENYIRPMPCWSFTVRRNLRNDSFSSFENFAH